MKYSSVYLQSLTRDSSFPKIITKQLLASSHFIGNYFYSKNSNYYIIIGHGYLKSLHSAYWQYIIVTVALIMDSIDPKYAMAV